MVAVDIRLALEQLHLDVFGLAPRGSVPWEYEINGLYVSRQIVAEMKRTNRLKDWPFATALGTHVLLEGDPRGWLHIFDEQILLDMAQNNPVKEYGIEKIIDKSLDATRAFGQKWMEYLPDVRENFENLF